MNQLLTWMTFILLSLVTLNGCAQTKSTEPTTTNIIHISETASKSDSEHISENTSENSSETYAQVDARSAILENSYENPLRNELLIEDLNYFKNELPNLHVNPFTSITKDEFEQHVDMLIDEVDELNNQQLLVRFYGIIAGIKDAHTNVNIWDGYKYPLQFYMFEDELYVINADKSLSNMINSKVTKINGINTDEILPQLIDLIPHENQNWAIAMLPQHVSQPVYMYGLGIIPDEEKTIFTIEKDGTENNIVVPILSYEQNQDISIAETDNAIIGQFSEYYNYRYFEENQIVLFQYNVCADTPNLLFSEFCKNMFDEIANKKVKNIIIDLRSNSGGNSEILNPFTEKLPEYITEHPDVKVNVLVGRLTFSSGMFAIYRIKDAVPTAITIGEPTGGAPNSFGEIKSLNLPNSQIPITYSTKLFELNNDFSYKNEGIDTFIPDVMITPSFDDYLNGRDAALEYAINMK